MAAGYVLAGTSAIAERFKVIESVGDLLLARCIFLDEYDHVAQQVIEPLQIIRVMHLGVGIAVFNTAMRGCGREDPIKPADRFGFDQAFLVKERLKALVGKIAEAPHPVARFVTGVNIELVSIFDVRQIIAMRRHGYDIGEAIKPISHQAVDATDTIPAIIFQYHTAGRIFPVDVYELVFVVMKMKWVSRQIKVTIIGRIALLEFFVSKVNRLAISNDLHPKMQVFEGWLAKC
jgi:hypothetical protein